MKLIDGNAKDQISIKKQIGSHNKESIVTESKLEGARKRPRARCPEDENHIREQNLSSNFSVTSNDVDCRAKAST